MAKGLPGWVAIDVLSPDKMTRRSGAVSMSSCDLAGHQKNMLCHYVQTPTFQPFWLRENPKSEI